MSAPYSETIDSIGGPHRFTPVVLCLFSLPQAYVPVLVSHPWHRDVSTFVLSRRVCIMSRWPFATVRGLPT